MTGNDPGDYGDASTEAGMSGFLTKPVSLLALRELLDEVRKA